MRHKTAFVSGANKGIGFEISKQLGEKGIRVILGVRDKEKGEDASERLKSFGIKALYHVMDVTKRDMVFSGISEIEKKWGAVDILINNAGIRIDYKTTIMDLAQETLESTFLTNVMGPLFLSQACIPAMKKKNYGRIVNMASSLGSISEIIDPDSPGDEVESPAYRLSKTTLNGLTALLVKETRGFNILINSVCPGWVRTDLGGTYAPLSIEEGADTPVWLAMLPDNGPSGGFFRERKEISW